MRTDERREKSPRFSERGVALVAVSAVIAITAVVTAEFTYHTNIDYAAAVNARDEMRAHFLARSGTELSRLVIKTQKDLIDRQRRMLGDLQLADYLPMITGFFGGNEKTVGEMAQGLGVPVGEDGIKGLGLPEGEFDIQVTTDDGKINANCANGSATTQEQLATMLVAMVAPNAYDRLFEVRDGDGQFTDRETFVRAIIDYVDRDEAVFGASGQTEEYGYESLKDPYRAKNNYLDSVDELQLVRGMDDKKWALFGSAFTIYGGCKVNVSAVTDINVLVAIIRHAAKNENDPVISDAQRLWTLAAYVAQARTLGITFDDLNTFAEFVKEPTMGMGGDESEGGAGGGQGQGPMINGVPLEGVELDQTKLAQVARAGGRRTYRVIVTTKIGRVEKKITAVFDTETTNQNVRDPAYSRGAWVYWREE